ncbi:MAG: leucine-rich repeat protein [Clostridia bacterium]|nr:leucine-rich repeat protein [Clostridia bacterium]
MIKGKKKLLLSLVFVFILVTAFAFTVCAEEIILTFYNGTTEKQSMTVEAGTKVTLPTEEVEAGKSFNWYTEDGQGYTGGDMVTFTESTKLYQKVAYDVSNFNDFRAKLANGDTVRLIADLEGNERVSPRSEGYYVETVVFLNGHTIKIGTGKNISPAWGGQRCGTRFYGAGVVEYLGYGAAGSTFFAEMKSHQWGGDSNQYFIGRDAVLNIPNSYVGFDSEGTFVNFGYPLITVYGKLNCYGFYDMRNSINREPKIVIHEGAEVIINGPAMKHSTAGNIVYMTIYGGTITTTNVNATASFFYDTHTSYTIEGGSFCFEYSKDYATLKEKINSNTFTTVELTVNSKKYAVVCSLGCAHDFKLASTASPTCYHPTEELYMCRICLEEAEFTYGDRIQHQTIELERKDATHKELGWIKYGCKTCWHITYEDIGTDPKKAPITVKVKLADGKIIDVDTTLEKIFEITSSTNNIDNLITAIKDFGEYTANQLYEFTIPVGVTGIEITKETAGVEIINFTEVMDRLITVKSLKGLTSLKTINIGDVNIKFNANCTANSVQSINVVAKGGTITFAGNAFKDITALKELNLMGNTEYDFGSSCFNNVGLTELALPDDSAVTFTGDASFYGCGSLKRIYVGKGIKKLNYKPFDCCYNLESIVLMSVNELSDYALCADTVGKDRSAKCALYVYSHSNLDMTGFNNAFANRTEFGVYLYAVSGNIESLSNCKYEIHHGIPHKYTYAEIEPTCSQEGLRGYVTDCPCNDNKGAIYKLYKSGAGGYEIVTLLNESIPTLPHTFTIKSNAEFANGFTENGVLTYKCKDCTAVDEENKKVLNPLAFFPGYSVRESGSQGIAIRYFINSNVLADYIEATGADVEYGIAIATAGVVKNGALLNTDGTAVSGAFKHNMTALNHYDTTFTITGLTESQLDLGFIMTGYIIIDGIITYIQATGNTSVPSQVTYNEILNGTVVALLPASTKEY